PWLQGNEEGLVKNYIKQNAEDPDGLEIVKWGAPRRVLMGENRRESDDPPGEDKRGIPAPEISGYEAGVIMHAWWRQKNRLGVKVLREGVFLIQRGKVVRFA